MKNTKRGIAPLAIVLIVAAVVAVGGGTTYAVVKARSSAKVEVTTSPSPTVTTSPANGTSGTLRDLLALTRDSVCTFSRVDAQSNVSGTVYISGTSMRADMTMKTGASAASESHMIRSGDQVYVWMGAQGAKMKLTDLDTNASAQSTSNVNLDEKVTYNCNNWTKEAVKFVVPTNVKFTDISATIQQNGTSGKIDCKVCNSVPAGAQRDQCLIAIKCKLEVQ